MKTTFAILALSLLAAGNARADFAFACGAQRDQGPAAAEISFVDSMEVPMRLSLAGRAVDDEKVGVKALAGGRWMVSVDGGRGNGSRQYVFLQSGSVQVNAVSERGEIRPVAKQPCVFVEKKD